MILHGQTHGGIAQGAGQALLEDCHYDPRTGQLLAASFMDYAMPRADTLPALSEVPAPTNRLGVRSGGESKLSISPLAVPICEPCCAARTPRFTRCGLRCRAIRTLGTSCAGGDLGGALISGCGGTAKSHLIAPRPMCCRRKDEGMFRLYYAPGTCALATHITLEEAGAPYEAVLVDFRSQAQRSPEYLAINPKGRVPALVTENGTLTETPALLCFVAQRFPNADLAPLADPFALAQVQEFNSYLCSTVHVAHAHRMRGTRWAD